jgi:hypothetical protein
MTPDPEHIAKAMVATIRAVLLYLGKIYLAFM